METETLELVPAGSCPVAALASQIELSTRDEAFPDFKSMIQAHPSVRRFYLAAALRCLKACKFYYDKDARKNVTTPDGATVMKAVIFLAGYDAGLPVQSTLNVNVDADRVTPLNVADAVAHSPALRQFLKDTLARAEKTADAA